MSRVFKISVVLVFLSLNFHHSLADEFASVLEECKNSCERSYPLHTYPKVSFFMHCTLCYNCSLLESLVGNEGLSTEFLIHPCFLRLVFNQATSFVLIFVLFRKSLYMHVNKGVDFRLSNNFKLVEIQTIGTLRKHA